MLSNWEKEFNKWLPTQIKVLMYDGKPEDRKAMREEFVVRTLNPIAPKPYNPNLRPFERDCWYGP